MMVLDWFSSLARAAWPDAETLAIEDFQVLAGVTFEAALSQIRLRLAAAPAADDRLELTLATRDGRVRYRAFAAASAGDPAARAPAAPPAGTWPLTIEDAYGGSLFHGPSFQVIRSLGACGDRGAEVEIASAETTALAAGRAAGVDVVCLDAGLQAALLWAQPRLNGGSLPTRFKRFTALKDVAPGETLRVVLGSKLLDSRRAQHDIAFYDASGALCALMEGVEMVAASVLGGGRARAASR
jgi:hypothetical protein